MELAEDSDPDRPSKAEGGERARHLQSARPGEVVTQASGSGSGPGQADKILDALKSTADVEFNIAERLSGKARQAFVLAAGVFTVSQTVAFGTFEAGNLKPYEKHWILGLAIGAVVLLGIAALATVKADATQTSGDLPLDKLEDDLNAAYDGDEDVIGRLGGYWLGVVKSRRKANRVRRKWYKVSRGVVLASLFVTVAELVVSLIARID